MTDQRQTLITLQEDAIGVAEQIIHGGCNTKDGARADLASDGFWWLTDAIHQSEAYLANVSTASDPADKHIAFVLGVCRDTRNELLGLF